MSDSQEYLILLQTRKTPEGIVGEFLGRRNRKKEALLNDLSTLFESYSKNSCMVGWRRLQDVRSYYFVSESRFPEAKIILVDIFAKPAIMEVVE